MRTYMHESHRVTRDRAGRQNSDKKESIKRVSLTKLVYDKRFGLSMG